MLVKIARILTGVVLMLLIACIYMLHQSTLVDWWLPLVVAITVGAILWLMLYQRFEWLSRAGRCSLRSILTAMTAIIVTLAAYYALNYCCSYDDRMYTIQVPVVKKYSEEHYKSRRVSRRTTVRGERYLMYYIELLMPDGRTKKVNVNPTLYRRLGKGRQVSAKVSPGFLGAEVIKGYEF